jgi:hypothetical protein
MGRSKKIDYAASWKAVIGEMVSLRILKGKVASKKGREYPQRKGTFSLGS